MVKLSNHQKHKNSIFGESSRYLRIGRGEFKEKKGERIFELFLSYMLKCSWKMVQYEKDLKGRIEAEIESEKWEAKKWWVIISILSDLVMNWIILVKEENIGWR
jgi:hypothetical protein